MTQEKKFIMLFLMTTMMLLLASMSSLSQSIAGGAYHSLMLCSDGRVTATGYNGYGQLGDGTTTTRLTPVQVTGLSVINAISAGYYHSLALKNDGTVMAWGWNYFGQIGDGTTTTRLTPTQVTGLAGITAISAGWFYSLVLKNDGTVQAWGDNSYGQLGDATTTTRLTPVQVTGLFGITAISACNYHSLTLKNDGTVWAWGYNGYGQLGDGTITTRLTPVQVAGLSGITAISAGAYYSLALKNDGTVWAWGWNDYGQLGDGTTETRLTPVQVTGLSGITAISAGAYFSLALKNDGTVWACGYNTHGSLGDGTTTNRITPVQMKIGPVPDVANLPPVIGTECYTSISIIPKATICGGTTTINGTTSDPLTYTVPGTYTVHWSYNDGNGNITTQNQTVIVQDITPPIAVAHNITVSLRPSGTVFVTPDQIDNGSYDNCSIRSMTINGNLGAWYDCSNIGQHTVTLIVTDHAGNSATCSAIVTVVDNTGPVITGPSSINMNNEPGHCGAVVRIPVLKGGDYLFGTYTSYGMILVFDKNTLNILSLSFMNISGISGEITRTYGLSVHPITGTWYAVVGYEGESGMVRSLVSIDDPVSGNGSFIGETGINVSGIAFNNAGVLYAIGGSSGPGANKLYTLNLSTGVPTYIMDVSVGGGKGFAFNHDDGMFYHKFYNYPNDGFEKIDPILNTITPITLSGYPLPNVNSLLYEGDGVFLMNGGIWVRVTTGGVVTQVDQEPYCSLKGLTYNTLPNAVRSVDGCGSTIVQTGGLPSGSLFPVGTTTNTYTATDASANSTAFSVAITINDVEPPVITVPSAPIELPSQPNQYAEYSVYAFVSSVTDNCTSSPDLTIVWISSDEPDEGGTCGPHPNDIIIATDCKSAQLRKERCSGNDRNGRVYNVYMKAEDESGNKTYATYQVTVPKGSSPAVDNGADHTVNSSCGPIAPLLQSHIELPQGYFLEQNYPNPFGGATLAGNPITTISYGIPVDGMVRLRVFDVHGRMVSELVHEYRTAGIYTVEFNASNLPSGIYLYRLEANERVLTGTMTLMK